MKKLYLIVLLCAFLFVADGQRSVEAVVGQPSTTSTVPSPAGQPEPDKTKGDQPPKTSNEAKPEARGSATPGGKTEPEAKTDRPKSETSATGSGSPTNSPVLFNWDADVWAPLVRLAGIAVILGALIWFLDLPSVLRPELWSERTIVAFAIIFTYCAAALMGANNILGLFKDVALVVIGFYFGSSKGSGEGQPRPQPASVPGPQPAPAPPHPAPPNPAPGG